MRDDEPVGPPLARAARLVADRPSRAGPAVVGGPRRARPPARRPGGPPSRSGRFDIVGLDPGVHIYQLVGARVRFGLPAAARRPAATAGPGRRGAFGARLRAAPADRRRPARRGASGVPAVGRPRGRAAHLRAGMVGHPQFVRRFETASQRITRVEHPHVVPLLDYWREPDRAVMVSRLMTGGHLGERIPADGFGRRRGRCSSSTTIASGVASAHRHGVVHGRIRPENVLFDDEGNAFVADLGHRRDLRGRDHVRQQCVRRAGAPRWRRWPPRPPTSTRSVSSCSTCLAVRHRRIGRCACRRRTVRSPPSSAGPPMPNPADAKRRSTS